VKTSVLFLRLMTLFNFFIVGYKFFSRLNCLFHLYLFFFYCICPFVCNFLLFYVLLLLFDNCSEKKNRLRCWGSFLIYFLLTQWQPLHVFLRARRSYGYFSGYCIMKQAEAFFVWLFLKGKEHFKAKVAPYNGCRLWWRALRRTVHVGYCYWLRNNQ